MEKTPEKNIRKHGSFLASPISLDTMLTKSREQLIELRAEVKEYHKRCSKIMGKDGTIAAILEEPPLHKIYDIVEEPIAVESAHANRNIIVISDDDASSKV